MPRPRITYNIRRTLQRTSTNYTTGLMTVRHLKHRNLIVTITTKKPDLIGEDIQKMFRSNKLLKLHALPCLVD